MNYTLEVRDTCSPEPEANESDERDGSGELPPEEGSEWYDDTEDSGNGADGDDSGRSQDGEESGEYWVEDPCDDYDYSEYCVPYDGCFDEGDGCCEWDPEIDGSSCPEDW